MLSVTLHRVLHVGVHELTPDSANMRWLHFAEQGGDPWVLPIWRAVNEAAAAGQVAPRPRALSELGVHISTRLNFLPRIVQRISAETEALIRVAKERRQYHEFAPGNPGRALIVDNDLKYRLLVDVDALLFELNSLYELWMEWFRSLHRHALVPMPCRTANDSIRHILATEGHSTDWLDHLNDDRNYFTHRAAPYLAMDISTARYDVLFLKSNVIDLSTSKSFVRLSEINGIVQGFHVAKGVIQSHLVRLFS